MKHAGKAIVALLGVSGIGAAVLGWSVVSAARAQDLPAGPDAMLVQQTCTGCHGADQFTVMHLSADQWGSIVDEMVGMGAQITDPDRIKIVSYLAANFPDTAPAATVPAAAAPATPPVPAAAPPAPAAPVPATPAPAMPAQ